MDKYSVTIFIETTIHGPAIRRGAGMYMIEYIKKSGEPETRQGTITEDAITENALALKVLAAALERLAKPCEIRINTECEHVLNVMRNYWLPQWKKTDWKKANGKPIKNLEQWKRVDELLDEHTATFGSDHNSYKEVMKAEMDKELKR